MLLLDVNVWIYAHREDNPRHGDFKSYVETLLGNGTPFGVSTLVMGGFLRVVTHPRVFDPPTPLPIAIEFVESIVGHPDAVPVFPGDRHWRIFLDLCRKVDVRGNLVSDAYFAALVIESGNTWVTTDRDYSRFPGLDWKHPLADF